MEAILSVDFKNEIDSLKKAIPAARDEYLGWVAEWKYVINRLSDTIRSTRKIMQTHGHVDQSWAQYRRHALRKQADQMYVLRAERKDLSIRQRDGLKRAA